MMRYLKHMDYRRRALLGSMHTLIWTGAVIIFFLLGFLFGIWRVAWLVFLMAAAASQLLRLAFIYYDGYDYDDYEEDA